MYTVKEKHVLDLKVEMKFLEGLFPSVLKRARETVNLEEEVKNIEGIFPQKKYVTPVGKVRLLAEATTEVKRESLKVNPKPKRLSFKQTTISTTFKQRKAKPQAHVAQQKKQGESSC